MSRADEFKGGSSNPSKYFLEWKSDEGCFEFYNPETKSKEVIPLPVKFLVLKELHTVKGFNDANNCGIYANEVKAIGTEPLTVKTFKGGLSITGIYKDIKDKIEAIGGVYYKSIYCMSDKGALINIAFKGAVVAAWGEFTSKSRSRLSDEWIIVEAKEDHVKGKVKYTTPVFAFKNSLTAKEGETADELYQTIDDHFKGAKSSPREAEVNISVVEVVDKDKAPF